MSWQFVPAPNYSGDIQIGFLQSAQVWWPAISVSHLANGVHSVDYLANGVWQSAQPNRDMGQSFILGGTTSGANQFQIRLRDVTDTLINNGRVYTFTLPSSCGSSCPVPYTQVAYTTSTSTPTSTPGPTASATASPTPPASPTAPVTASPTASRTASPTAGSVKACAATYAVTGHWDGGFQGEVAVRNTGAAALTGWRVTWTYANGQMLSQVWNGTLTTTGAGVSVTNASYNGSLPVNGATTFGFLGSAGSTNTVPAVSCTGS